MADDIKESLLWKADVSSLPWDVYKTSAVKDLLPISLKI